MSDLGAPLLEARRISKSFGAVEALVEVDLEVRAHEVVALVGDNGAGTSTLAKIIAGVLTQDSGTLTIEGRQVVLTSPSHAYRTGVATVYQDLALCENLDVTANIFLGREVGSGLLSEDHMEHRAREYLARLGARIPSVRAPLSSLSAGQRQSVAIARTLVGEPRLIVLHEPTAALSVSQTAEVLTNIEGLRAMGLGVILISHNMNDVRAVSDRIEVLRHGRNNGSFEAGRVGHEDVLAAITGATALRRPRPGVQAVG